MPNIGGGQRGSIVYAIAGHGHHLAKTAPPLHGLGFLVRLHLGVDMIDAKITRNLLRDLATITRGENYVDPLFAQFANGHCRGRFDGIGQCERANELLVYGHEDEGGRG